MEQCPYHAELTRRIETCEMSIDQLYSKNNSLNEQQIRMDVKLDWVCKTLEELKVKIDALTQVPGKRWEAVVTTIITVIASGVAGAILMRAIV